MMLRNPTPAIALRPIVQRPPARWPGPGTGVQVPARRHRARSKLLDADPVHRRARSTRRCGLQHLLLRPRHLGDRSTTGGSAGGDGKLANEAGIEDHNGLPTEVRTLLNTRGLYLWAYPWAPSPSMTSFSQRGLGGIVTTDDPTAAKATRLAPCSPPSLWQPTDMVTRLFETDRSAA